MENKKLLYICPTCGNAEHTKLNLSGGFNLLGIWVQASIKCSCCGREKHSAKSFFTCREDEESIIDNTIKNVFSEWEKREE